MARTFPCGYISKQVFHLCSQASIMLILSKFHYLLECWKTCKNHCGNILIRTISRMLFFPPSKENRNATHLQDHFFCCFLSLSFFFFFCLLYCSSLASFPFFIGFFLSFVSSFPSSFLFLLSWCGKLIYFCFLLWALWRCLSYWRCPCLTVVLKSQEELE